jgi:hypothetical protein
MPATQTNRNNTNYYTEDVQLPPKKFKIKNQILNAQKSLWNLLENSTICRYVASIDENSTHNIAGNSE